MKIDIKLKSKHLMRSQVRSKHRQLIMIIKFKILKIKLIQKIRKYLICKIILFLLMNRILRKNYRLKKLIQSWNLMIKKIIIFKKVNR